MENSRAKKCMSERIISVVQQVFHPLMLMLLHSAVDYFGPKKCKRNWRSEILNANNFCDIFDDFPMGNVASKIFYP